MHTLGFELTRRLLWLTALAFVLLAGLGGRSLAAPSAAPTPYALAVGLAYDPATGQLSVTSADVAGQAATATPTPVATNTPAPAGPSARLALDYTQGPDLFPWGNNEAIPAGSWNVWLADRPFTVESAGSLVVLNLRQAGWIRTGSGGHNITAFRFDVDNGARTEPICASGWSAVMAAAGGGDYTELCGGSAAVTGLAAGVHQLRISYFAYYPNNVPYLRPTSYPNLEFIRLQVVEHR